MKKMKKCLMTIAFGFCIASTNPVMASQNETKIVSEAVIRITKQPSSQTYVAGQKVVASVGATGTGLKYQWEFRLPNQTNWSNWSGAGNNTAETSYNYPASFSGIRLRCRVTDAAGKSVVSDEAVYTVAQELKITKQPTSQTYAAGQKVVASVSATGTGLKYQWEFRLPNQTNWSNWSGAGCNTAETSYNYPASFSGIRLRCRVTDAAGKSVVSDEAVYTMLKTEEWELPII